MQEFNNKGQLTAYALSCGCMETHRVPRGHMVNVNLWKEHGTYHVRAHNHTTGKRLFWDSFDTLTKARKRFSAAKKHLKAASLPELAGLDKRYTLAKEFCGYKESRYVLRFCGEWLGQSLHADDALQFGFKHKESLT